jgi:hypothetical protein
MKKVAILLSLIVSSVLGQTQLLDQPDFPDRQTITDEGLPNGINLPDRLSKSGSFDWKRIAQLTFKWEDNQWKARWKEYRKYSIDELQNLIETRRWITGAGELDGTDSIRYNADGLVTYHKAYCAPCMGNNQNAWSHATWLRTYDENNKVATYEQWWKLDGVYAWKLKDREKYENSYDSNNNLLQTVTYVWDGEGGGESLTLQTRTIYSYDSNNNQTERLIQRYNADTEEYINVRKYTYVYDANNNRTEYIRYGWSNNGQWIGDGSKVTYTYDSQNQLIETHYYKWDSDNGVYLTDSHLKIVSVWDANGNESERKYINWNTESNDWVLRTRDIYSYDSHNNRVLSVQKDGDGTNLRKEMFIYSNILGTEDEGDLLPKNYTLHDNYPNPFNPTTTLRFDLPEVSDVTVTIFNMLGQRVRTFNMNDTPAGYHSIKWDATNDLGEQVGAGVYLYQLRANQFVKTRKMVLLK